MQIAFPTENLAVYDLEVLPNYFLIGVQLPDGTVYQLDAYRDQGHQKICDFVEWLQRQNYQLVGFNSSGYDDPVLGTFMRAGCHGAYDTSKAIIEDGRPPWNFYRPFASIDVMQLLPGRFGLKLAGIRMGHPKLQEFPTDPHKHVTLEEGRRLLPYNLNDMYITRKLVELLSEEIKLRGALSRQYGTDMRSKGDATMAELILLSELQATEEVTKKQLNQSAHEIVGDNPQVILRPPDWWGKFPIVKNPQLWPVLNLGGEIFSKPIDITPTGRLDSSAVSHTVTLGDRTYQMGVGGLHSIDGAGCWIPKPDQMLLDLDVASFYPNLILTQQLTPRAWGGKFQEIYSSIVSRRMEAKRSGDSHVAYSLKIAANGVYGKTSDPHSSLYDPQMTAHVTLYGQLSLLVLIGMVERAAYVCSANTDGITVLVDVDKYGHLMDQVRAWERMTRLDLEEVRYTGLWQRDVNNYFAVTTEGKVKKKGRFVSDIPDLQHNPDANVVPKSVMAALTSPRWTVIDYIEQDADLQNFLMVQALGRGWTSRWKGQDTGRFLRFYKSTAPWATYITRYPPPDAKGNEGKVANSDQCVPVPDTPVEPPEDLDRDWYIRKAQELLSVVNTPKVPGMNEWARYLASLGLKPCFVPIGAHGGRASVDVDATDYTSWPRGHELGVKTGAGILAKVTGEGETILYRTRRDYPTRTRRAVWTIHGFALHYSDRVPLSMDPPLIVYDEPVEGFDEFYTPAELRKVGRHPTEDIGR